MLSIEWLILIGVGVFVVGGLAGYLLRSFAFGGSRKEADLARALEESEQALADYKQEVMERFSDTADKFRRLNESYSDLHQQLAESAVALCGDEITTPLLERPVAAEEVAEDVTEKDVEEVTETRDEALAEETPDTEAAREPAAADDAGTAAVEEGAKPAPQPASADRPAAS